ncbi:MAG: hypothetical protein V3V00_15725 [Saprospiraceae bacterium]
MGMDVMLFNKNGGNHPDWNDERYYCREFCSLISDVEIIDEMLFPGTHKYDCETIFRPNTVQVRELINKQNWDIDAKTKYLSMCDIIETDDNYYIYYNF